VAITQNTRDADEKLRKELEHADLGKFKKAVKKVLAPSPKTSSKKK